MYDMVLALIIAATALLNFYSIVLIRRAGRYTQRTIELLKGEGADSPPSREKRKRG